MSGYVFELTPDDNGTLLVTSAAFPELATFGEDDDGAIRAAMMALEEAIAARMARGEDIPSPQAVTELPPEERLVMAPASLQTAFKVYLYNAMREQKVTRAEMARRLRWHRNQVDRLFMLDHATRLDQFEAAFGVLSLQPHVVIEPRNAA